MTTTLLTGNGYVGNDYVGGNISYGFSATTASFSVAPQNLTSLLAKHLLNGSVTTFTITEQNLTSLLASRFLNGSVTTFVVTEQNLTSLLAYYKLDASFINYAITPIDLTGMNYVSVVIPVVPHLPPGGLPVGRRVPSSIQVIPSPSHEKDDEEAMILWYIFNEY